MPIFISWMPQALLLTLVLGSATVQAVEASATATSALKVLLGPSAVMQASASGRVVAEGLDRALPPSNPSEMGPAPFGLNTNVSVSANVTVQRGETLDRVIRRALPNLPLHPDFLRKAFVSLNPQAFPTGSVHLMRAGSTLRVPSMVDLRQMMLQQNPEAAALFNAQADTAVSGSHGSIDKRRWVRFP